LTTQYQPKKDFNKEVNMYFNLDNQNERQRLIEQIESNENKGRKSESYKRSEIYKDRIKPFVITELRKQFDEVSIQEIPVSSGVNICKRAINKTSIVYLTPPKRTFSNTNENQSEQLNLLYTESEINVSLAKANKYFKLHNHVLIQVKPEDKKLIAKVFQPHQWDAIYYDDNPEKALGYVFTAYDKADAALDNANQVNPATGVDSKLGMSSTNYTESLAIKESSKSNKRYSCYYYSEESGMVRNYIFNSAGEIISDVLELDFMPFVEVADGKENEYWVRNGSAFSDFTVEFNVRLSESSQVVKMQGFSQAYLKGPKSVIAQNVKVGPTYILRLPVDKENNIETDFGFASTNADINGTIEFLKSYLFLFLSSQSLDQSAISTNETSEKYASGFERLIAMIDRMITNKDDFEIFMKAEKRIYEVIKGWLNATDSTETLEDEIAGKIPEDSKISIEYVKPESVQTEAEEIQVAQNKIEMGVASPISVIMKLENVDRVEAEKRYNQYIKENSLSSVDAMVNSVKDVTVGNNA
jgi:hypothetical protein